jgi:hypothetical protein
LIFFFLFPRSPSIFRTVTNSKFPLVRLALLLGIGALAALSAFSLLGRQGDISHWGIIVTILLLTYFISWTGALFVYLRWRDRGTMTTHANPAMDLEALKGTVYGLVPGAEYRVMQTFTDYYNNQFQRGELLRFKERHFLPYHGGHTIMFHERPLYLQEDDNATILSNFSSYIAPL